MTVNNMPNIVYPHPVLTPIIGRPTNSNLQILQTELFANALSVEDNTVI
jgi:hypothetical protein